MPGLSTEGFDKLDRAIASLLKDAPTMRRELHKELSDLLKGEVDSSIAMSVHDPSGKIKNWQEKVVGSGGGYAAVRPVSTSTGAGSPGAITNYIESGHRIRTPLGKARRPRRSRARVAYVDGRHFYQGAATHIEAPAIALAEAFVEKLAKKLEE